MTRRRHMQDERAPRTRALPGEGAPEAPSWMADALCAQMDGDFWFPEQGEAEKARSAAAVCKLCPAQLACAAYIFDIDPLGHMPGVWAGLSQRDRQRLARGGAA